MASRWGLMLGIWLVSRWCGADPVAGTPDRTISVDSLPTPEPPSSSRGSGLFLRVLAGLDFIYADSEASVVSAYRQDIPSRAYSPGFGPHVQAGLGFMERFVTGLAYENGNYLWVRGEIRGLSVDLPDLSLQTHAFGPFFTIFPASDPGWHASVKVAWSWLVPAQQLRELEFRSVAHPRLRGPMLSLFGGYEWPWRHSVWFGGAIRLSYMSLSDQSVATTRAWVAGVGLTATYH